MDYLNIWITPIEALARIDEKSVRKTSTGRVPRTTISSPNGHLSNCKQEIRHHPRLFLSDNDDSVVLLDQLRQAPPIDFVPPTLRGSRFALLSAVHPILDIQQN